ncbi:hypothetical protein [Jeotgalibacillus proteolyticus]|uniref:Uncharacterized protein n=1 Tax=Jeotgalibacillus proteolyticus TaxID=2082395 RepID=A0A2S5GDU9_9BACL|nr:hypothetical protein [Jeotgalibacillus proteolyticus]PPA71084.1 hypothetical protein C4B60_09930 [Jeotgalibacillus proteolyticus]
MKLFQNTDADALMPGIMTSGLLLIVTSFFIPAIAIMFIQDMLFFSSDHWTFIRPSEAFIGFGAGMIWMGIVLFSLLFTKMYAERKNKKYKLTWLHLLFLSMAAPVFVLSIYHYYSIDEQGVKGITFWSASEDHIAWEEVEEVSRVVEEGSQLVFSYTFKSSDTSITIPYDPLDTQTVDALKRAVYTYEWEVIDHFVPKEEQEL